MELFTIHASKDGDWVETQDTSPTLTVAKGDVPIAVELRRADVARMNVTRPS